jgi:hypothetical protein
MVGLLDVIVMESLASFLLNDVIKTITIICTTHNTINVSTIWKGLDWESFLLGLLNAKVSFKVVAYIYDRESFKSLLTIVNKLTFVTKIRFEFGQYLAQVEVLGSLTTLLNIHVLMFAFLFLCKIGTNVCLKILGNKKLSTLVECLDSSFPED